MGVTALLALRNGKGAPTRRGEAAEGREVAVARAGAGEESPGPVWAGSQEANLALSKNIPFWRRRAYSGKFRRRVVQSQAAGHRD